MRARGPHEVKPRQLRALVLLLVLLPLLPTTFVIRFLLESIANEQVEARERTKPRYQQFLDNASALLAARTARALPDETRFDPAHPWDSLAGPDPGVDAILLIQPDGQLALPSVPAPPASLSAESLARGVLAGGVHYVSLPPSGPVRWRFFSETPEPLFALHPRPPDTGPDAATRGPSVLLICRRQRLLDAIGAFYQRALDPQTTLHLVDENGDSIPLVGPDEPFAGTGAKPLLAETALQPPLPAWRVRLYSVDAALVDGVARGQIAFYWWTVGGMFLVTAAIAGAVGLTLTRRIALHELGNDALAVVSHEMKTPLASTRLFIETLLDRRYHGTGQADEYLRLIAEENARLERLVESFQLAARLGGGRRQRRAWLARREPVRAEEIAAAACTRMRARLESSGCELPRLVVKNRVVRGVPCRARPRVLDAPQETGADGNSAGGIRHGLRPGMQRHEEEKGRDPVDEGPQRKRGQESQPAPRRPHLAAGSLPHELARSLLPAGRAAARREQEHEERPRKAGTLRGRHHAEAGRAVSFRKISSRLESRPKSARKSSREPFAATVPCRMMIACEQSLVT